MTLRSSLKRLVPALSHVPRLRVVRCRRGQASASFRRHRVLHVGHSARSQVLIERNLNDELIPAAELLSQDGASPPLMALPSESLSTTTVRRRRLDNPRFAGHSIVCPAPRRHQSTARTHDQRVEVADRFLGDRRVQGRAAIHDRDGEMAVQP
jgi:hypothetical protein